MFNFLLYRTCVLCNQRCKSLTDLCQKCKNDLPWLTRSCIICAQPLLELSSDASSFCSQCLKHPPVFQRTIALFHYDFPIDYLITRLKFQDQLTYAKLLGQLLAEKIAQSYTNKALPTLIIPVPLHKARLQERGFNQSLEISKPVSKKLNISIDKYACKRQVYTQPQTSLRINERKRNVKNAFHIQHAFQEKHIAIIDDVVTTGETVNELAKTLLKTGVETIDIWCCARTAPLYQK